MAPSVRNGTGREDTCCSSGSGSVVVGLAYEKRTERTMLISTEDKEEPNLISLDVD